MRDHACGSTRMKLSLQHVHQDEDYVDEGEEEEEGRRVKKVREVG